MDSTPSTIISIIVGFLLTISELLPFLKNVEANGIINYIVLFLKHKSENTNELNPLLNELEENHPQNNLTESIDKINYNLTTSLNKNASILDEILQDFRNIRQVKLQNADLYQLNYIINYIKTNYIKKCLQLKDIAKNNKELLISEGYVIDYDSITHTYSIKW